MENFRQCMSQKRLVCFCQFLEFCPKATNAFFRGQVFGWFHNLQSVQIPES